MVHKQTHAHIQRAGHTCVREGMNWGKCCMHSAGRGLDLSMWHLSGSPAPELVNNTQHLRTQDERGSTLQSAAQPRTMVVSLRFIPDAEPQTQTQPSPLALFQATRPCPYAPTPAQLLWLPAAWHCSRHRCSCWLCWCWLRIGCASRRCCCWPHGARCVNAISTG